MDLHQLYYQNVYNRKYNKKHGVCSDTGYDALKIVMRAINKDKAYSGTDFRDSFYKMKGFEGAAGSTTFDKNGDVEKEFIFKIVEGQQTKNYGN